MCTQVDVLCDAWLQIFQCWNGHGSCWGIGLGSSRKGLDIPLLNPHGHVSLNRLHQGEDMSTYESIYVKCKLE